MGEECEAKVERQELHGLESKKERPATRLEEPSLALRIKDEMTRVEQGSSDSLTMVAIPLI